MKQMMFVWFFFGFVFLWNICGSNSQRIVTVDNCTCRTSDGDTYSLWPIRRTDGKPKFLVPGIRYPGWRYTYNPCTPVNVGQDYPHHSQVCRDVAMCKYAEIEDPREYFEIGLQKGFDCEINQEGKIELVYRTHDPTIDNPHSRVVFHCDESATVPIFKPEDEDNYIFSITSYCACPNRCSPYTEFDAASPGDSVNVAVESKQNAQKPEDSGAVIVPVIAVLGVLVSIIVGAVLWRRHRANRHPLERQQLFEEEVRS